MNALSRTTFFFDTMAKNKVAKKKSLGQRTV
jgi:hypothetical protein